MVAIRRDLIIQAGSYEPVYWTFTDPESGSPLNLTAGYLVSGAVADKSNGHGTVLLLFNDNAFRRTDVGRVYFEPSSAVTASWLFRFGYYQFEIRHPSGQDVRFSEGRFIISPEL